MKIGFICGSFDVGPHAGHIATFAKAKEHCDKLIVGLHTDPSLDRPTKNRPIEPIHQRAFKLYACKYVDQVIPYERESDLLELLALIQPNLRFLGSDYKDKPFTGDQLCKDMGTEVLLIQRYHNISSSNIRSKLVENLPTSWQSPGSRPIPSGGSGK